MSYVNKQTVTITVDASGDGSATIPINGILDSIHYVKDDYVDGVDFTITETGTGETLWTEVNVNASKVVHPAVAVTDTAGVTVTYDGTNEIYRPIALKGTVSIVVAQGGNATSGTFHVVTRQQSPIQIR